MLFNPIISLSRSSVSDCLGCSPPPLWSSHRLHCSRLAFPDRKKERVWSGVGGRIQHSTESSSSAIRTGLKFESPAYQHTVQVSYFASPRFVFFYITIKTIWVCFCVLRCPWFYIPILLLYFLSILLICQSNPLFFIYFF